MKLDVSQFRRNPEFRVHALVLLRRRLQGLFGRSFQLEVGQGTAVTLCIPLGFENANRSLETVAGLRRGLAS
jgi:hypothetical protein